jgi:hypothetical protein
MENNFQFVTASPATHTSLSNKGLQLGEPAVFNENDNNLFYIINNQANLFWMVDSEGRNDANRLVKHITGKEIQPLSA